MKEDKNQKNLMFDIKDVSIFRLYFHLSEPLDYFLMIMGFIVSLATGVSTTSEISSGTQGNIETIKMVMENY